MDLLFQKSLTDVIKSLRAAPSPAEEAKILAKTLRDVRREVKSSDPRSKAAALEKLLYLHMLGQAGGSDIAWAAFPSVEAMGCHRSFAVKYVGYLAAAHSLSSAPDVAVLATHQLRKDLTGQHPHDASLALSCIASAAPPGLAAELTTEVVALLNGTRVAGRRKATLAMLRIVHQQQMQHQSRASGGVGGSGETGGDDDELPALLARLAERLHDSDRAVVTAVVSLVCELVLHEQHQRSTSSSTPIDPTLQSGPSQAQQTQQQQQRAASGKPLPSRYLPLAPDLFPLLHPSSSPWLLIKLVKTFAALAAAEPRVARKVAEPLAALLRATPSKSLLLESVRAVALSMRHVDSLRQLAIRVAATRLVANEPLAADLGTGSAGDGGGSGAGGAAASSSGSTSGAASAAAPAAVVGAHDANVRLLGLRALEMFLPHHALEVLRFKSAIIASLDDADPAVQSAALRLITALVTRPSLVPSVAALRQRMAGAAAARSPLCGELVTAVLQMCGAGGFERVADFVWYIDVLQDICYVAIVGGGTSTASLALPSHAGAGAAAAAADESVWSLAPLGDPSASSHGYSRRVSGASGLTHALSAGAAGAEAWAGSERSREVGRHLVAVALGSPVPVADRARVRAAALHLALRLVGDTALLRSRAGGDHVLAAAAFLLGECAHELLPRGAGAAAAAGARESSSTGSGTTALSAPSQSPSAPPLSRSESAGALDSTLSSLLASLLQPSVLLLPPATQAVFLQAALKVLLALTAQATPTRLLPRGSSPPATGSSLGAGSESPGSVTSGGCAAAGTEARWTVAAAAMAEAAGARGSGVHWVVHVLEEARERLVPFLQSADADVADRACNVAALLGLLLPLLLESVRAERQVDQEGQEGGGAAGESDVAGSTVEGKPVDWGNAGVGVNEQHKQQQLEQQLLMLYTLASLFPASQFDAAAPHPPLALTPPASKVTAVGAAGKQQLLRAVEKAAVAMGVGPPGAMPCGSSSGYGAGAAALAWLDAFGQSSHDEWDSGILFVRSLPPRFLPTSSIPSSSSAIPGSRTAAAAGGAGVALHGGAMGYAVPGQTMGGGGGGGAGGASTTQQVGAGVEGSTEEWRKRNSLFYLPSGGSPKAEGRGKEVQSREGEGRGSAGGAEFSPGAAAAAAAAAASSVSARGDFPSAVGDYDYPPAVGDEAVAEFLPWRGSGGGSKRAPPLSVLLVLGSPFQPLLLSPSHIPPTTVPYHIASRFSALTVPFSPSRLSPALPPFSMHVPRSSSSSSCSLFRLCGPHVLLLIYLLVASTLTTTLLLHLPQIHPPITSTIINTTTPTSATSSATAPTIPSTPITRTAATAIPSAFRATAVERPFPRAPASAAAPPRRQGPLAPATAAAAAAAPADAAAAAGAGAAGHAFGGRRGQALTGATSRTQLLLRGGWRGAQLQAAGRSGL
ncbi:unnamed protein product [Closterium sp. NIES-64]|nr:unnamed protein product [Closterium sp. NIES-64]